MKRIWLIACVTAAAVLFNAELSFAASQNQFTALSAEADPHTGSANFAVPIDVPPGRGGIQPNIQLHYNSSAPNGILGVGWNLELGAVQRSGKGGVPRYDDTDTFVLIQSGGAQELVYDSVTGLYRAKTEGAFMKIERLGGFWKATDKSGTVYTFGETPASQEYDPADSSRVFKWCLNKVEDPRGNTMTVDYFRDENKLYPQNIDYTGNSKKGWPAFGRVVFEREPRPENEIDRYNAGFRVSARYRISRITASVDGSLQGRYDLIYDDSRTTGRSLLSSVIQFGSDGTSSLPPMTFSYQTPKNPDFTYDVTPMNSAVSGDNLWNYRVDYSYDRGHENYGPCPPTNMCNSVNWGPLSTKGGGNGNVSFSSGQDAAHWLWTYLYVDNAATLSVPYQTGGVDGVWLNGNYSQHVGPTWSLQAGYNVVEITLYHQHEGFSFNLNYALADNVGLMSSSTVILPQISGDFNADGRSDIATFTAASGKVTVERSNGTTFAGKETWITGFGVNGKLVSGDFNGDGRVDISGFDPASGNWRVASSDGTRFNDAGLWLSGFGANEEPSTGDFNADGLADVMTFYKSSGNLYVRIALNQEGSFAPLSGGQNILIGTSGDTPIAGDFNGDGQVDFGAFNKSAGNWDVRLNTGDILDGLRQLPAVLGFGAGRNTVVSDFNYDGLTDIGYYDDATGKVVYRVSKGLSFAAAAELPFVFTIKGPNTQIQSGDFNGDTLIDFAVYNLIGRLETALSDGVMPDILSSVENGLGGQSLITYNAAVNYPQTFLPFPIQVVASITKSNGLGESYTIQNSYEQGLWDAQKREFRGFGLVRVTDPDGNYADTFFAQDGTYKGRVTEQRVYDAAGKLYSKTVNTWAHQEIIPDSNFIYLSRKDNFVYDADTTGRRTAEEFFYEETPQYGNLTRAVQLGEVDVNTGGDIANDTRSVETSHVNNTAEWLIGLPTLTVVKDNAGTVVRKTWFDYTNGFLTRKEDWAGDTPGAVNPVTQYTYDTIGNLLTMTDALGRVTAVAYDSAYNMFPVATTNALGHQVSNEYYGVAGAALDDGGGLRGLWGQLKSTTDPNNQAGRRVYDVFGRATASISPKDSIAFPTQTTEIEFLGSYTKVAARARVEHGKPETIDTVSFIDGFGREVQTKTRSEVNGRYVVSGQAQYNSRGLKSKEYLPAFSANPMDVIDAIDTAKPHTLITYDAMGRVARRTNPDGTYATIAYDDWTSTSTDENGRMQKSYFDAYGRLIKKEEYLGADGRSPHYPAKPYTLYAATLYSYDSEGNLLKTIDAYGNTTTITYDPLGRKTAMDDPDMGHWSYQYDLNGNLIRQTDAKGQTLTFTYDGLNRLVNKSDAGALNVSYTYDDNATLNSKGRLTRAAYANGNTQFAYDELGRELQSVKEINSRAYGVSRGYDALSRLTTIQYPQGENVVYRYNSAGQIEAVANDPTLFPPAVLTAPELGVIQTSNTQIKLTWSSVADATGYKVKYGLNSGNYTMTLDAGNATSTVVAGLTNGIIYYFTIVAYNAETESSYSNERSAVPVAPFYSSTQLLLLFDDPNTSTTVTDVSARHIIAARGNAQIDTAVIKVGQGSLWLDGTGDFLQSDDSGDWDVVGNSSQDWTVDFWVKHEGLANAENYMTHFEDSINYWELGHVKGTGIRFRAVTDGIALIELSGGEITDTSWHHIAFIKVGDRYGLYKDGVQVAYLQNSNTVNFSGPLYIGSQTSTAKYFHGHMDNVRVAAGNIFGALPGIDTVPGPDINWSVYPGSTASGAVTQGTTEGSPTYVNDSSESTAYGASDFSSMGGVSFAYSAAVSFGQEVKTINKVEVPWSFGTNAYGGLTVSHQVELFYDGSWHAVGSGSPTNGSGVFIVNGPWHNVINVRVNANGGGVAYQYPGIQHKTLELRAWGPEFYTYPPNDQIAVPLAQGDYIALSQRSLEDFDWNHSIHLVHHASGSHNNSTLETDDVRSTHDEVRGAMYGILAWIERHILGVDEAYAQTAPADSFQQDAGSDGLVVMEAESYHANILPTSGTSRWDSVTTTGQSGTVSLKANPNSGINNDTGYTTKSPRLDYKIKFVKTGTHYVWIRGIGTSGVDDSVHAGLDGAAVSTADRISSFTTSWKWSKTTMDSSSPAAINITSSGEHTLNIWMREDGFICDKIVVTTSAAYVPSGTGPAESPRAGASSPALTLNDPVPGDGQVFLSWNAVEGALGGYIIRYGTQSGVYGDLRINAGNATASTVTGLTNGTTYYFIIETDTNTGLLNSNELSATPTAPVPVAPLLNSATAGDSLADLAWGTVSGVTGYKIYYGTASGQYGVPLDAGSATSYTVTGLTNGTTYYFAVTAYNSGGESVKSNEMNAAPVLPPPQAPVLNAATAGDGQVDLSWGSVTGASGYKIKYGTASGSYTTTLDAGNVTARQVTGLSNGTTYYFVVTSYNASGDSTNSNELSATPVLPLPPAPVLNTATAGNGEVSLSWSVAVGATGYKVYYGTVSGQYGATPVIVGNTMTTTVTGLTNGTTYYFAVTAYNAVDQSEYSNEVSAAPVISSSVPAAPLLNTVSAGNGQVFLSWNTVNGAQGYKVRYGTSTGQHPTIIDVGDVTSFFVSPLANGTTYYFVVSAYNTTGESLDSNEMNAVPYDANVGLVGHWTFDETAGTTAFDSSGHAYHGAISGTAPGGVGSIGGAFIFDGINDYVDLGQGPAIVGKANFSVSLWVKTSSAAGQVLINQRSPQVYNGEYVLEVLSDGRVKWWSYGNGQYGFSFASLKAVNDGQWHYVAALRDGSGTGKIYIDGNLSGSQAAAARDLVATNVYVGADRRDSKKYVKGSIDDVRIYNRVLSPEEITVLFQEGGSSLSAPVAPVLNTATAGDAQVSLAWSGAATATGYKIHYGTSSGSYPSVLDAGDAGAYTLSGLTNGTTYYFVVSAYSGVGESINSNELSAAPTAPVSAAPLLNSATAGDSLADLAWGTVSGAVGYKIYYGTASGQYGVPTDAGSATSYTVTGLTNGTTYYFAVSAYNSGGESTRSNELSATPAAPVVIVPEEPTLFVKNVDYNAAGQITKIEYGNGDVTTYTYDPLTLRLTRLSTSNASGETLQDLNYTYDSAGNILSITDKVHTATQSFKYDELNRLTEAAGGYGTKSYVYDTIGNIVEKDGKTYFYGDGVSAGPHAVTALSDGTTFSYDANGNLTQQTQTTQSTQYAYDSENRLLEVKKGGSIIARYEYDGDGGRTKKVTSQGTVEFIGQLFEKTSGTGYGIRDTKYVFLGDQRIASITSSSTLGTSVLYYHADHLGGTNVLTDAAGFKKELIEYEPFGLESRHEKYGSSEEVAWYYFTGKPKDDETGLYYFGARYYDPSLGRFITPDTIVPWSSNPQAFNRYSYVLNNPINRIDPTGHWSWKKFWKSFAGAFVGAVVTVLTAGAGAPLWAAGMAGGFIGGATTGGLTNGWQGAWQGALIGGALGGLAGWGGGIAQAHQMAGWYAGGLLAVGAGVAGATNSWDSFLGGVSGGILGGAVGVGINDHFHQPLAAQAPKDGISNNQFVEGRGILTTPEKALKVANDTGSLVLYRPSRNIVSDIVRAGMNLAFKNSLASRQMAGFIQGNPNTIYNFHSEMTITALGAASVLRSEGAQVSAHFNMTSAFYPASVGKAAFGSIGASANFVPSNLGDSAGMFSNIFNPLAAPVYGAAGLLTGEHYHAYETYKHYE